jgi:hypothetical protein
MLTPVVVLLAALLGASQTPGDAADPLYPTFRNGLWGLVDTMGRVVLEPRFEQIGRGGYLWIPETWNAANPPDQVLILMTFTQGKPVTDRVIPVRLGGRYALATRDGGILVHGEYEGMAGGFSDGLLRVRSGDRFGFLDQTGDLVIPARWEDARAFRDGHAFVMDGGRWGIIDRTGAVVVEPTWDQIEYPREWTPVRRGNDWGVVDASGRVVVPLQYDEIRASPMGPLLPVHDDGRILYLRPDGAGTVAFEFECPRRRDRGRARALGFFWNHAALVVCGERYGVINESGAFVLEPEWEDIGNFMNGRALVRHRGKKGVIDESGRFVIPLQADLDIWGVGEEEIGFSRGNQHGFFDRDGTVVRTFTVDADRFGSFQEGLAVARRGIKDGYIDTSGTWVIQPRFHRAEPFSGPLAVVQQPVGTDLVEIGYINRQGEALYRTTLSGFAWPERLVDPAGIGGSR